MAPCLLDLPTMVRPANLSLFAAWVFSSLAFSPWRNKNDWKVICIAAGAGMLLPLLPQMAINYFFYDTIGFLPTRGLGPSTSMSQYQTLLGLENLKYATVVLPDRSAVKVFYPNPMFRDQDIAQMGYGYMCTSLSAAQQRRWLISSSRSITTHSFTRYSQPERLAGRADKFRGNRCHDFRRRDRCCRMDGGSH